MLKRTLAGAVLLLTSTALFTAYAQNDEPSPAEQAASTTETRQAVFKLLGYNMGAIGDMAQGDRPFDAAIAERNALRIAAMAPMIPELFQSMDTRDFDVETRALDDIWEYPDQFESRAMDLVQAANEFASVAAEDEQMETLGAVQAFGSTCGDCHDEFRADD